jgi:hypothetical protein
MVLFVLIGNRIMEIRGMGFHYWIILFSTACYANMLGLNISDGLKSAVAIYVLVPFLLVPMILLAGVIVQFDKLHYRFAEDQVVPMTADAMVSRWAYEALTVSQFTHNRYQQHFVELEKLESDITYDMQFLAPALIQEIQDVQALWERDPEDTSLPLKMRTIRSAFEEVTLASPYAQSMEFSQATFTEALAEDAIGWLENYRRALRKHRERLTHDKDALIDSLERKAGGAEAFLEFRRDHHNESVANLVLNRNSLHKIIRRKNQLIRKMEPVYMTPVKRNGRAHFYASEKQLGSIRMSTIVFNLLVIWLHTFVFFVLLRYSALRRFLEWMERKGKSR